MAERDIVAAIVRSAKKQGWWTMKIHGGPYQPAGIPDLLLVKNGQAFFLEVKQPGKHPTPIQVRRMQEIETQAGAKCYVVTGVDEANEFMRLQADGLQRTATDQSPDKGRRAVIR